jgi:copper chaperone
VLSKTEGKPGCNAESFVTDIRLSGVSSFDISLEKQEVIVRGPASYDDVLEKIKKTGKEVRWSTVVSWTDLIYLILGPFG